MYRMVSLLVCYDQQMLSRNKPFAFSSTSLEYFVSLRAFAGFAKQNSPIIVAFFLLEIFNFNNCLHDILGKAKQQ